MTCETWNRACVYWTVSPFAHHGIYNVNFQVWPGFQSFSSGTILNALVGAKYPCNIFTVGVYNNVMFLLVCNCSFPELQFVSVIVNCLAPYSDWESTVFCHFGLLLWCQSFATFKSMHLKQLQLLPPGLSSSWLCLEIIFFPGEGHLQKMPQSPLRHPLSKRLGNFPISCFPLVLGQNWHFMDPRFKDISVIMQPQKSGST